MSVKNNSGCAGDPSGDQYICDRISDKSVVGRSYMGGHKRRHNLNVYQIYCFPFNIGFEILITFDKLYVLLNNARSEVACRSRTEVGLKNGIGGCSKSLGNSRSDSF